MGTGIWSVSEGNGRSDDEANVFSILKALKGDTDNFSVHECRPPAVASAASGQSGQMGRVDCCINLNGEQVCSACTDVNGKPQRGGGFTVSIRLRLDARDNSVCHGNVVTCEH